VMNTTRARLVTSLVAGLLLAAAGSADAQEWKIYMIGKVDPIVASYYAEETPWIFYRDDESMYVFALGCNRVAKVERDGTVLPTPACPVERVPTTIWRIYVGILELEGKRLDDSLDRLRGLTTAYNAAVANATIAAANAQRIGRLEDATVGLEDSLKFLNLQLGDARSEVDRVLQSSSIVSQAAGQYRVMELNQVGRRRYFFAPR